MRKTTFGDRFRYAFDNVMSRGTGALIGWLVLITVLIIIVVSVVVSLVNLSPQMGFIEMVWKVMTMTIDQGTITGEEIGNWPYLLVMLAVTLLGIVLLSTLIGIVTTGIDAKLTALRKGRSKVIEHNHTIILGFSEQVFATVSEIVEANANQPRSSVVILAERDKVEMEDEIRTKVGRTGRTRIICRRGIPIDMDDLAIVSLDTSRSIIILSPDHPDPDSEVIKTILAICNNPTRRAKPYHIVAEIRDPRNMEVARMVGAGEVELLVSSDLVARITAQTCRQTGLSVVYGEILDFEGDEIYFHTEPSLAGTSFGDALFAYEDSAVIGIVPAGGKPKLNPPMDTVINEADQLIVIAEDDDTTHLSGITDYKIDRDALTSGKPRKEKPDKILLLGWNWRTPRIIRQIDSYVTRGSSLHVVASLDKEDMLYRECSDLKNLKIRFQQAETTDRRMLDSLNVGSYDHVVILCYSDELSTQEADAKTLITLLHLRDIAEKQGHTFSIVSEMLDERNRNLAEVARVDDFIVSDKLVSQILSQVSENKRLSRVFDELFDPEGAEIYLKPAGDYVKLDAGINFYTVLESARRKGEVAIGYKLARYGNEASRTYGIVVNPDKSDMVTFAADDKIIVLAED
jgi:voltage-gated potassium channel Kch